MKGLQKKIEVEVILNNRGELSLVSYLLINFQALLLHIIWTESFLMI